jgi:hypothetical protein
MCRNRRASLQTALPSVSLYEREKSLSKHLTHSRSNPGLGATVTGLESKERPRE